jgi:hypothetical protein
MNNYTSLFTMEHVYKQPPQGSVVKQKSWLTFLLLGIFTMLATTGWGQTTIASEGFNNSSTLFNLNVSTPSNADFRTGNSASGDRPASTPFAIEGTHAYGVRNTQAILTSTAINTSAYTAVALEFRLASFSMASTGNGAEAGDYVLVEVSPDNGTTYYETLRVNGAGNSWWGYNATGVAQTAYDGDNTLVTVAASGGGENLTGPSTVRVTALPSSANMRVKITILNNANGEQWVIDDFKITGTPSAPAVDPELTVANNGTQIAAGNIEAGSTDNIISTFTVASAEADASLTDATFIVTGNYLASDVTSFKLWASATNTFGSATTLGTLPSTSTVDGDVLEFTGMTYAIPEDATRYFWLTADVSVSAVIGRVLNVDFVAAADLEFAAGSATGSASAAGVQTIIASTAPILWVEAVAGMNFGSVCTSATGATTGSFELYGDNLAGANVTVTAPTGYTLSSDNITFSGSLTLPVSAGGISENIYVRFSPSTTGAINGDIAISSTGVTTVNVPVTGTGIAAPSISTHPTNQNAVVGNTATFSVTASGATSYQWEVNEGSGWNNVSTGTGGTTASYTTASTTLPMNGYDYRVVVTNACGNTTSNEAELTVVNAQVYERITDVSELADGYYVIAGSSPTYSARAMNNVHNGTYFAVADITVNANDEVINPDASIVWKIETNGSGKTVYNEALGIYVSCQGTSNSSSINSTVSGNNERYTFSNQSAGNIRMTSVSNNGRSLQMNVGANPQRFLFYGNTQQDLTLYRLAVPVVPQAPVITSALTHSSVYGSAATNYTITADFLPTSYSATGLPAGLSIDTGTGVISGTPTVGAGTYNINITAANAEGSDTETLVWTITPKTLTVSLAVNNKVYDATTTATISGTPTLNGVVGSDNVSISGTPSAAFADKNVGNGKTVNISGLSLTGPDAANYTLSPSLAVTANITSATLTASGATAQNKVYDGITAATITGTTLAGVLGTDVVTVSGGGTFNTPDAGTGKPVTANLVLGGTDGGNYTLTQPSGLTANITKATPVITASTIGVGVGSTHALPAGITSTSNGAYTYSITAGGHATLSGNIITGVSVGTETLTVNQAETANYNAGSTTVTVNVTEINYAHGDWRTRPGAGGGNWLNNASTTVLWDRYSSVNGWEQQALGSNPSGTAGSYTVYITENVTVPGSGTSGGFATAKLHISNNATLTYNLTSTQWTFRNIIIEEGATLEMNGRFTMNTGGEFEIMDGGNFIFGYNANAFSTGTGYYLSGVEKFHPNSNFIVKTTSGGAFLTSAGMAAITPNSAGSYFGNLIVDYSSGENNFILITSGSYTNSQFATAICNDLVFRTNNSSAPRIYQATTSYIGQNNKLTILGDFVIEPTFNQSISFTTASHSTGSYYLNVKGDFIHNGPAAYYFINSNANNNALYYMQVEGNMTIGESAKYYYRNAMNSTATMRIELTGNLTVGTNGELADLTTNNFAGGDFWFVGTTATQLVSYANQASNTKMLYQARSGSSVELVGYDLTLGTNGKFTVKSGAKLNFGFNGSTALNIVGIASTGTGFTSEENAYLIITSPWGLNVSMAGMLGNVSVNSLPAVNTLATFHYVGKQNQSTGDVIVNSTLTSNGKIVIVELENNILTLTPTFGTGYIGISNGTTLDAQGGKMEIRRGIFQETPTVQVAGSGRLVMTDGTFRSSVLDTQLPQLSNHANYSLTGGTVELNGNGDQILKGSPAGGYYNVAVTNAGNKTISSGFAIANNLLITDGVLDFQNYTVNGAGGLTMTGGRLRLSRKSASLPELAGTATPYALSGGTVELYGTSSSQTHSLRGTFGSPSTNINYYNIELNSDGGNVGAGGANVVAGAGFGVQGTMTVFAPTTFQLASNLTITGAGTFDLQAGATLKYGGTINASGNTGNIRTAVRNFPSTASYGFVGSITPQQAGDGLPAQAVNLYMDKNASANQVQLSQDVTLTGALRFYKGILNTGEGKVTIAEGGSVSGAAQANGYVQGTLEKFIPTSATAANYEVGMWSYTPVNVALQNVTHGGYMSWRARAQDHPQIASSGILNPDKSINRYYTVGLNDISLTGYSPTFHFVNGDKDLDVNTNGLSIGLYNGSWNEMYVGTRNANSTQALNAMLIGDFAIAEAFDMVVPPANDNAQNDNPNFNHPNFVYPNCTNVQGTTTNATVHPATGLRDVWYRFIAKSNGVSIRVSSSVIDARIYLFDANDLSTPLDVEDLIVGTGTEVLNFANLIEGHNYRIAVASNNSNDGTFNICVSHLRIPTCNVTAERSLCELLHTGITGSHSTVFNFTNVLTNAASSYTSSTYYMTLSTPAAQLQHGATYEVSNTAIYNLQDGLGATETISVGNGGGCVLTILPHRLVQTKANQRCTSNAVLSRTANLNGEFVGTGGICGHNGFIVEFTPVANCAGDDPQVLETFAKTVLVTTPYISLNYAFNHMPLAENPSIGYWSVRWKPRYVGYTGEYGPAHVIAVNGTAPAPSFAATPAQEPMSAIEGNGGNISSNIYPNPNNGDVMNINLTGVTSNEVFVRIMDGMGRVVYTNRYSVDGSLNTMVSFSKPLAQGVYMVEFTAGNEVITQRMMVTK